ncbi:MAG: carboxypeptidase-like regulatory domain-containing protein, partial [Bacteroidota bacterium]
MTKKTLLLILLSASSMFIITVQAQELSQSIRGKVTDKFFAPLAGANIRLTGTTEHNLQTDERGVFSRQVPVGRYKLAVSFTGFETQEFEVVVNAGRETVVNISMMPSATMLGEVQIESSPAADEVPGLRSLSIEKALRIPANFFDPVRVATAFPAVVAANDQNNSIVVRGNSPNGLLWRLNGLDIVNPNHLANAGTFSDKPAVNGGGVNILSAQMLDRTNFYSGAFPA